MKYAHFLNNLGTTATVSMNVFQTTECYIRSVSCCFQGELSIATLANEVLAAATEATSQLRAMASSTPRAASRVRELLARVGQPPTLPNLPSGNTERGGDSAARQLAYEKLSFWAANLLLTVSPAMDGTDRMELLRMSSTRARLLWLKRHMNEHRMVQPMGAGGSCSLM
jgi:hypothetical protein